MPRFPSSGIKASGAWFRHRGGGDDPFRGLGKVEMPCSDVVAIVGKEGQGGAGVGAVNDLQLRGEGRRMDHETL